VFHLEGWTDGQSDGRIERHDEANSHFSQFYERAKESESIVRPNPKS